MKKEKKVETVLEETPIEVAEEVAVEAPATPVSTDNLSEYDHKMIDHDIKYRGPLSYRYLRLIGWVCMTIMFISMILGGVMKLKSSFGTVSPEEIRNFEIASEIMSYLSAMPLPLFLIANFAVILQSKNNYKKLLITYGGIFLAIYIGFLVVYYHYVVVLLMSLGEMSFLEARELSILFFSSLGKQNGLVVNVFVDLFCCVLIMFFIDYTPKRFFQGKKIILFRLLALLPILYEILSAVLVGLLSMNAMFPDFYFALPPEVLPLIGKKPIGMILAFTAICIFVKIREKVYIKRGGTKEGYELYSQTNRYSFRFSSMMATTFAIVAILDLILVVALLVVGFMQYQAEDVLNPLMEVITGFTVGKSVCLLLVIPFVLLFSYSRTHKNPKLDKLVPVIGIGLVVFAIIETVFFSLVL